MRGLSILFFVVTSFASFGLLACGGGEPVGDCPSGSEAQQADGHEVVTARCVPCHSSKLSGASRQDAPDDLNFDVLETVRENADEMYGEAKEGAMPPSPLQPLGAEELESMRIWLACGAK